MSAWNAATAGGSVGVDAVTLVEGSSFCISAANGDLVQRSPHGVFFGDTRILSRWNVLVNDTPVEPLGAVVPEPYHAVFVGQIPHPAGHADSVLVIERDRRIGDGLREDLLVRNFGQQPLRCVLSLVVAADFADLFDVKGGRLPDGRPSRAIVTGAGVRWDCRWPGQHRGVIIDAPDAIVSAERLVYRFVIAPREQWRTSVVARPVVDEREYISSFPLERSPDDSEPARRLARWRQAAPRVSAEDDGVAKTLRRSEQDLGALRIFDAAHPGRAVLAAGAPWFMALFGRDSLLTSLMALPLDRSLALSTLRTLADHQGTRENPVTEEQPGRILHEVRLGVDAGRALGGRSIYYGSIDSTPLFVTLLGELCRWGLSGSDLRSLLPAADRALAWIGAYGDRDGDGFVEYLRSTDHGLINQGWKDSWDAINFVDGSLAEAPIALCEVQGYVYSAYLARARIADSMGDAEARMAWTTRATSLKREFNERFWMPERGYYAIALDRNKMQVDACASNMGQCLWSGIVDKDKARAIADRMTTPEMFSGWGVRTLATTMGAYNPASYHNGSVWPHDNALIAAGLMRYGFVEQAQRIAVGLFDAANHFNGRLPELFCGFSREEYPNPIPYPTSCSPQAWSAAAPIHLIRTLLRFDPDMSRGLVYLSPELPAGFGRLQLRQVPVGDARLDIDVTEADATLRGAPATVRPIRGSVPLPGW